MSRSGGVRYTREVATASLGLCCGKLGGTARVNSSQDRNVRGRVFFFNQSKNKEDEPHA